MEWVRIRAENYPADNIQDLFEDIFTAARAPRDAALFLRHNPAGGADYFVSPGATGIFRPVIEQFGGQPCPVPAAEGTLFLVGHADARNMLTAASRG